MACQGTVKSFNAMKGFGFVDYQGTDVFFHIRDCQGNPPQQGDLLTFDTAPSDKDPSKLKASNVSGGTGSAQGATGGPPVQGTGAYQATCKSFNGAKLWGFIDYQGQDIFVHQKNCQGNPPQAGDLLTFDLEESPVKAGQMHATNVTGGTGIDESAPGQGKGGQNARAARAKGESWGMGGGWGGMGGYGPAMGGGYGPAMSKGGWGMGGGWGGDSWGASPYGMGGKGGKGGFGGKGGWAGW